MKEVPLTKGYVALVDDSDYENLSRYSWGVVRNGGRRLLYAVTDLPVLDGSLWRNGKPRRRKLFMHRMLLGEGSRVVDHKNGDGLDNRRCNLRPTGHAQNLQNRGRPSNNTSGFKGVYWCRQTSRWAVRVTANGKTTNLGRHKSKIAAAIEYNIAAVQFHGEFAKLNDVFSGEVPL